MVRSNSASPQSQKHLLVSFSKKASFCVHFLQLPVWFSRIIMTVSRLLRYALLRCVLSNIPVGASHSRVARLLTEVAGLIWAVHVDRPYKSCIVPWFPTNLHRAGSPSGETLMLLLMPLLLFLFGFYEIDYLH